MGASSLPSCRDNYPKTRTPKDENWLETKIQEFTWAADCSEVAEPSALADFFDRLVVFSAATKLLPAIIDNESEEAE